jgi:hypothetical protein
MENNIEELNLFDKNKYSGLFGDFPVTALNRIDSMIQHLDTQINILISLSSAVFLFSATQIGKEMSYFFFILAFFSALAIICGLFAIHPPKNVRKRGQRESLIYNKSIFGHANYQKYLESIKKVVSDPDLILEQYVCEAYNMASYVYQPKRKLFKISRNFFLAGIILSSLFYVLVYFKIVTS